MKLLALDSGLEKTGWAILSKNNSIKYCSSGLIKTKAHQSIPDRIKTIYDAVRILIVKNKIDTLVMEQLFYFKNQKTFIAVSQAQGAILLLAAQTNLKTAFLTPLQIKQTVTGYGVANKESLQKMIGLVLDEKINFQDDDQSDAVACGLAYCYLH